MAAVFLLAAWLTACGTPDDPAVRRVLDLAPDLPGDLARHLVRSDDSTLFRYAGTVGTRSLAEAEVQLYRAIRYDSPAEYQTSTAVLFPLMERIHAAQHHAYGFPATPPCFESLRALTPDEGADYMRLTAEKRSLIVQADATPAGIERLKAIAGRLEAYGIPESNAYAAIAEIYSQMGDQTSRMRYLQKALAGARECGNYGMSCQVLGVMAAVYHNRGQIDSMTVCYERVLEIGHRYRLPYHTARIYEFYSNYYFDVGRVSLASRLSREAIHVCREYMGGYFEQRFVNASMEMHARLDAWDVVARLLPRARELSRSYPAAIEEIARWNVLTTDQMEARYLMTAGRVDEAEQIFDRLEPKFREVALPSYSVQLARFRAEGLVANGRGDEAIPYIEAVIESAAANQYEDYPALLLLRGRAEVQSGDPEAAGGYIERFDRVASDWSSELRRERRDRDVLAIDRFMALGDSAAAATAFDRALSRLISALADTERGTEGYLWMGGYRGLRRIARDMAGDDPVVSLGAELYMRGLYRWLGAHARADTSAGGGGALAQFRRLGELAASFAGAQGATFLVYAVYDNDVCRWTCDPDGGVRRQMLDISSDDLASKIRDAWKRLAADPADDGAAPPPSDLVARLGDLFDTLVPNGLVESGGTGAPVYISADRFLRQLPFEALHVNGDGDYYPLLKHCDVAYVRHLDRARAGGRSPGAGLIAVNTGGSPAPDRRLNGDRELRETLAEANAVADRFPDAAFLRDEACTKATLRAAWENAGFVYIAGHNVSDPDAPYLSLLPLARSDPQSSPEAAFLDVADVRSADLSRCEVAVLSGCATGSPFVGRYNSGPSFGDAFLDAGAAAAVQTFWDVRDDQAARLMEKFVNRWDGTRATCVSALCDARREVMRSPLGIRHPFCWAGYAVQINAR